MHDGVGVCVCPSVLVLVEATHICLQGMWMWGRRDGTGLFGGPFSPFTTTTIIMTSTTYDSSVETRDMHITAHAHVCSCL